MRWLGGDVGAMRVLAARMEAESDALQQLVRSIAAGVDAVWWQGPDADRFRSEWSSVRAAELVRTAAELREIAARLRGEAQVQEQASSS